MLVLTRHVHQSIVIGHDVVVTVLEVRGDQVRLGITAPKEVQVHREEVFAALTAANRQAATSASGTELDVLKGLSGPAPSPQGQPGSSPGAGSVTAGPASLTAAAGGGGEDVGASAASEPAEEHAVANRQRSSASPELPSERPGAGSSQP